MAVSQQKLQPLEKKNNNKVEKPRPILIHFSNYSEKQKVYGNKKMFKNSGFSVCEYLTKIRSAVYKNAKDKFGYNNVWTTDGTILIKHKNRIHRVTSQEELNGIDQ